MAVAAEALRPARGRWTRRFGNAPTDVNPEEDVQAQQKETEFVAPALKEKRRWRRDCVEPDQLHGETLAHAIVRSNARIIADDGGVSSVIAGLCPKSKLSLLGSARLLQSPTLANDFASVLQGGAHHLKRIFCRPDDHDLYERLKAEIEDSGLWRSRQLDKYERTIAPEGGQRSTGRITGEDAATLAKLPAHRYVLEHLAVLFDAKPLSWWINLYPSGRDAKNFHKDRFGQNITIGASFGATRKLTFRHAQQLDEFDFLQENGDVFAFREKVNDAFLHGMHPLKSSEPDPGPRISVIMMGRSCDTR